MYELINNVQIKIKEYKGYRVVTFKDIDMVHGRPNGTARKRFNDNRKRFIEGEDYFVRNSDEAKKRIWNHRTKWTYTSYRKWIPYACEIFHGRPLLVGTTTAC